jgi:hypothetical protein
LRRAHPAVESTINALEVHGLDQCPDYGIDGFKRYVSLAVVARNIHRLGTVLRKQEKSANNESTGPTKKRPEAQIESNLPKDGRSASKKGAKIKNPGLPPKSGCGMPLMQYSIYDKV